MSTSQILDINLRNIGLKETKIHNPQIVPFLQNNTILEDLPDKNRQIEKVKGLIESGYYDFI